MRIVLIALLCVGLFAAACSSEATGTSKQKESPWKIERVENVDRITLSAKAAERLDIQTGPVRRAEIARAGSGEQPTLRWVVPYSAVMYTTSGDAFVYTNPEPLTFVLAPVSIDYIEGDLAVLTDRPEFSAAVVTVGATELYGIEAKIGY